jgi:hypothetical protein
VASVDVPIVRPTTEAAPKDYEIPAAQEIAPLAVRALVDGSGAGSAFVPALQLISPGGQVMWTAPTSETVAAGASADVSWFPRVGRGGGGGADPNAVHYDVSGETGDFVDSQTTTTGGGYSFTDRSGRGIYLVSDAVGSNFGFVTLDTSGAEGQTFIRSAVITNRTKDLGWFEVQDHFGQNVFRVTDARDVLIDLANIISLNGLLQIDAANIIAILPIMDPGVSGALWNNGGFVAVSPYRRRLHAARDRARPDDGRARGRRAGRRSDDHERADG